MTIPWNPFSQEVAKERQKCRDYGLSEVNNRLPAKSYKAQALRYLAMTMELQAEIGNLTSERDKSVDRIETLECDLDIAITRLMNMTMDYDALERTIAAAREAAKTEPGPYGGRYVGRQYNKKTEQTEFLDLGTDDSEVTDKTHPNVDVLVQCKPQVVYPFGRAQLWIKRDGTVDRDYLNGKPPVA